MQTLAIFALTLLLTASSALGMIWEEVPQNVEVKPEKSVLLRCRISGDYTNIRWLGKTLDQETDLIYLKTPGQKPMTFNHPGFAIENDFDLRIQNASFDANNGIYKCIVQKIDETNDVKEATVTVLRPPTAPSFGVLSGGVADTNGPFVAGNTYEIACSSTEGNPPPRIVWTLNGNQIIAVDSANSLTLKKKFTRQDQGGVFACSVNNNAIDEKLETTFTANVEYSPEISISKLENKTVHRVIENKDVTLTCNVDANPATTSIKWKTADGADVKSNTSILNLVKVALADAGKYVCEAVNSRGTGTGEATLDVLYGPKVTVPSKEEFTEGEPASVECVVDSNPSPTQTVWLKQSTSVSQGPWLNFTSIDRKDASFYECSSSNKMVPTEGIGTEMSSAARTEVVVNYKPGVATVQGDSDVTVDGTIQLTCSLDHDGVPAATYKWQFSNGVTTTDLSSQSSTLSVSGVKRKDEGSYFCWGQNAIGRGTKGALAVSVNTVPVLRNDGWPSDGQINIKEDGSKELVCVAEGKPIPTITWEKDGTEVNTGDFYTVVLDELSAEKQQSTLQFKGAGRPQTTKIEPFDAGSYKCTATNVAGAASSALQFNVLFQPRLQKNQLKFASVLGQSAQLQCTAEAFPQPTFVWKRKDGAVINEGQSLRPEATLLFQSTLTIQDVKTSDYGAYECTAENDEGRETVEITLTKRSQPDAPTNMEIVNLKYDSATLRWKSGFNGGSDQRFSLVLSKGDASGRKRRSAIELDKKIQVASADSSVSGGTAFSYNMSGLDPAQLYSIKLDASNDLGSSDYARASFTTHEFPVKPEEVPGVDVTISSDRILTANVGESNLTGWNLCLKVETTTGSTEDYKLFNDNACAVANDTFVLADDVKMVRASVCVKERPSVCGQPVEKSIPWSIVWWMWLIIGVAAFLVLVLLIIICCCCRRRDRKEGENEKAIVQKQKQLHGSPPDYDNDTAHRKRQTNPYRPHDVSGGADNPAHDIDFADGKIPGVYSYTNYGGGGDTLPNGAYIAKPVNVIDQDGGGGQQQPPLYWPSSTGGSQRPLSSYNPYMSTGDSYSQLQPPPSSQHGTFRQPTMQMGGPASNPYILDYDDDTKKPDGYDSGYSAEDHPHHPTAAPQRHNPQQKSGAKRTIYEVVV